MAAILGPLFLLPSLFSFVQDPLPELDRGNGINQVTILDGREESTLMYSWHDLSYEVVVKGYIKQGGLYKNFKETSQVLSYMTAVAPHYSTRSIYLASVDSTGATVIEKWSILVSAIGSVSISKTTLFVSNALTHLSGLAVGEDETFLVAKHHETGNIIRIDTNTWTTTALLSSSDYPDIGDYQAVQYRKHKTLGRGFVFVNLRAAYAATFPPEFKFLVLWDHNPHDGLIDSHDDYSGDEWVANEFHDEDNWERLYTTTIADVWQ